MRGSHGDKTWFNVDVFAVHRSSQIVAQDQTVWVDVVVVFSGENTMFSLGCHGEKALDMFLIFVSGLRVPESYCRVLSLRLGVRVNHCVGEVSPFVVWPDVGEVNEGIHGQSNPE